MVNDDAPRPHSWGTPRLGEGYVICEVCGGYKTLTAIGREEQIGLVDQVENSEAGRAFAQHLAEARDYAFQLLDDGIQEPLPRSLVVEGEVCSGELPDFRWEEAPLITDLFRCPGRDPRVG